jgi:hypothetical protein
VSAFHHDVEPVSLIDAVGTVHTSSSCRWALTRLASGGSVTLITLAIAVTELTDWVTLVALSPR